MKSEITEEVFVALKELGGLLIDFSKVYRTIYLDTDKTPESDTDHTVMLSIMACVIASKFHPEYDLGKVAQYALVHDLVEVYAGDVNTIDFHTVDQAAKTKAEEEAVQKIKTKFGAHFPWLHETIETYEKLADPEARFVKTLDKAMPAVTHQYSNNMLVNEAFDNPESFERSVKDRDAHMKATFAADQEIALAFRHALLEETLTKKYAYHGKKRQK